MGSSLRIDYQGLEDDTISRLKKCESRLGITYDQMNTTVSSLTQYMEADTATAYINEFTQLVGPSIESMETIVREYYIQLQQILDRFDEVDGKITANLAVK